MMVITALLIVTVPVMQGDNKKDIQWVPSFQLFNSTIIVLIMKLEDDDDDDSGLAMQGGGGGQ